MKCKILFSQFYFFELEKKRYRMRFVALDRKSDLIESNDVHPKSHNTLKNENA